MAKRPLKRSIESKPSSITINLDELKALSGDDNAILDFVKGMLSGSPNSKQLISENSNIQTVNDDTSQRND